MGGINPILNSTGWFCCLGPYCVELKSNCHFWMTCAESILIDVHFAVARLYKHKDRIRHKTQSDYAKHYSTKLVL